MLMLLVNRKPHIPIYVQEYYELSICIKDYLIIHATTYVPYTNIKCLYFERNEIEILVDG